MQKKTKSITAAAVEPSYFEHVEMLFECWGEWRRPGGPLVELSAGARELLFSFLCAASESTRRGYLVPEKRATDAAPGDAKKGARAALADPLKAIADVRLWSNSILLVEEVECWQDMWPEWVRELEGRGFLGRSPEGVWFSPQMVRGEI